jgi:hypothetical protein
MDERRMGQRVSPTDLTVLWCAPGTKVGSRRASKRPSIARVLDISQSGAQVVAGADDRIQRGTALDIQLRAVWCEVRVRWVRPTTVDGVLAYGIEFVAPDTALVEVVTDIIRECYERDGRELRAPPVARKTGW